MPGVQVTGFVEGRSSAASGSRAPRMRRARVGRGQAAVLLFLLASLVSSGEAATQRLQGRPNAAEAEEAIGQLRSPYCPGFMLETCTSPQAYALRDSIYDLAAQGATSEELVEWMLANHGEEWRAVPPRTGAGLLAWLMPPLAVLVAGAFLVAWLRSNRAAATATPDLPSEESLSAADRDELARALREWEDAGEEEL